MNVPGYLLAAAFTGAIAQRLVRTICPECRATFYPPGELLRSIRYEGDYRRPFVRGEGCANCADTGYRGQTGIYESLLCQPELREIIGRGCSLLDIRKWHQSANGTSLLREGIVMAERGVTSLDEVVRVALFD
jgi:type II secretory ATPase GspE/PulE/Tfp pilus assembly ATPase PilB-like protein